jgi:hypothetical protein
LTLGFHAQMGSRFFEGHFHLPALHEAIKNESRRRMHVK